MSPSCKIQGENTREGVYQPKRHPRADSQTAPKRKRKKAHPHRPRPDRILNIAKVIDPSGVHDLPDGVARRRFEVAEPVGREDRFLHLGIVVLLRHVILVATKVHAAHERGVRKNHNTHQQGLVPEVGVGSRSRKRKRGIADLLARDGARPLEALQARLRLARSVGVVRARLVVHIRRDPLLVPKRLARIVGLLCGQ